MSNINYTDKIDLEAVSQKILDTMILPDVLLACDIDDQRLVVYLIEEGFITKEFLEDHRFI